MILLLRFLRGFVDFEIIGSFPERFLNITARNGIFVWNSKKSEHFTASMYMFDYLRVRKYARKSRVKLRIIKKHGLPIYITRYKYRVGVLLGVAVFTLTVYVMSCFLWTINVTGLETVSYSELMSKLRDNGVYVGAYMPNLDFSNASRNIMLDIESIGWMSINVTGSHASVEVKEKADIPKIEERKTFCNVKAKRDGVILDMQVSKGKTLIQKGSGVVKGELLVSGVVEDQNMHSTLVSANAKIIAKTKHEKTFSVSKMSREVFMRDKIKERKRGKIFTLDFPLSFSKSNVEKSIVKSKTESAMLNDIVLPLSVKTESIYPIEITKVPLCESMAKKLLSKYSYLFETFDLGEASVEDRKLDFLETDDAFTLTVSYDCVENIAYREEIGVDENADLSYHREMDKEQ